MNAVLEDWKNGWSGLRLALSAAEIDHLIELLGELKADPGQHFHVSSDYRGSGGLGNIEISVLGPSEPHNMRLSSLAHS